MCLHSALCIGKHLFGFILLPGSMHEVKHLCVCVCVGLHGSVQTERFSDYETGLEFEFFT